MKRIQPHSVQVLPLVLGLTLSGCIGSEIDEPSDDLAPVPSSAAFLKVSLASDGTESGGDVAVFDDIGEHTRALTSDIREQFYLAINRDQLGVPWFFEVFVDRQVYAGGIVRSADFLGRRVVEFAVQNGRLLVLDVSSFGELQEIVLESYPVVTDTGFSSRPGADSFIVFDPAAGASRFRYYSSFSQSAQVDFVVDALFLKEFEQLDDGISFEQVVAGHTTSPAFPPDLDGTATDADLLRAAATLRISVREYRESPGFRPVESPTSADYYFKTTVLQEDFSAVALAQHWHLFEGMEPIEWRISRDIEAFAQRPEHVGIDVVGAVARGIEYWNTALGFDIVSTRLADPDDELLQNGIQFVGFRDVGAANAIFRGNERTGEISEAGVIFTGSFVDRSAFDPDVGSLVAADSQPTGHERSRAAGLGWANLRSEPACELDPRSLLRTMRAVGGGDETDDRTVEEKVEELIAHTMAHEIGHTLGLRHNLKGSLLPPSSSVMDNLRPAESADMRGLGSYDISALRYLYLPDPTEDDLPSEPFCTDGDVSPSSDVVNCFRNDRGSMPVTEFEIPFFRDTIIGGVLTEFPFFAPLVGGLSAILQSYFDDARGVDGSNVAAFNAVYGVVGAPVDPARIEADPAFAELADSMTFSLIGVWAPVTESGPPSGIQLERFPRGEVSALLVQQLEDNATNVDGIRTGPTRRRAVDVLERMQTVPALQALLAARREVRSQMESGELDAEQTAISIDLIARIDAAVSPYFD